MERKTERQIILIAAALAGTCGVCYLLGLAGTVYPDFSILSVFLAVGIYVLLRRIPRNQ